MTTNEAIKPPCINGCKYPAKLLDNGEKGDPEPRLSSDGLLCKRCASSLKRWLGEIPELYAILDTRPEGGVSARYDGKTGKTGKASHSPALARVDVIALLDPRTVAYSRDPQSGELHHDGLMDIAGVVCEWAQEFTEEQSLTSPVGTLVEASNVLVTWFSTLAERPWIDEMWTNIQDAHKLLMRATGRRGMVPRGHCQACGKAVYADVEAIEIQCTHCKTTYVGAEIIKLADNREQAERGTGVG